MFKLAKLRGAFLTEHVYPKYVNFFQRKTFAWKHFRIGIVISCAKYRVKVSNRRGHHKLAKPRKSSLDLSKFPAVGNHFRRSPNFTQTSPKRLPSSANYLRSADSLLNLRLNFQNGQFLGAYLFVLS